MFLNEQMTHAILCSSMDEAPQCLKEVRPSIGPKASATERCDIEYKRNGVAQSNIFWVILMATPKNISVVESVKAFDETASSLFVLAFVEV